jgi:peptidoglycan L-alanyl-D-glutamate endopeptidase CwlK
MPKFSAVSLVRLNECDHHLQILFTEVIKHRDCAVLYGHRGQLEQDEAVKNGASKTPWPKSTHNTKPSRGIDVAPCILLKVSYNLRECYAFGGFVMGLATAMNLGNRIRWGGDWDGDGSVTDQTFDDLVHFEMRS